MKNFRVAAVLAALLVALGLLATWDEWKTKKDDEVAKTKNRLTDIKAEDVVGFEYVGKPELEAPEPTAQGQAPKATPPKAPVDAVAEKKDGVWRLTKPVDALADAGTIDALLRTIVDYTYTKDIEASKDKLADFGLADPARKITLRTKDGKSLTLSVGNKVPVGYNVYFRTDKDDKVYMGSQMLLTASAKTLTELRDKTLVKVEESKVKGLTYERKGQPTIELVKADGKWSITKPEALPADGAEARELLGAIGSARVTGFVDAPDASLKTAFATPDYVITWTDDAGAATKLRFVVQDKKLLGALDPDRILEMAPDFQNQIRKELLDFRERKVLQGDMADIKEITVDGTSYAQVNGTWYAPEDAAKLDDSGKPKDEKAAKPEEKAHMRAFVVDLEFAKTDRFLAPSDPTLTKVLAEAPLHKIVVKYRDATKKPDMALELFKDAGGDEKYVVRKTGAPAIYRMAKTTFNSMTPPKPGEKAVPAPGGAPEGLDGAADMPAMPDMGDMAPPPDAGSLDKAESGATGDGKGAG